MARRAEATPGHPNKSVTRKQTPDDTDNATREKENSGKKQERRRNNGGTCRTDSGKDNTETIRKRSEKSSHTKTPLLTAREQTPDDTDNAAREKENSGKKQERRGNNSGTSGRDSGQDDGKTRRKGRKQISQSRSSRRISGKELQRNHGKHLT